MQAFFLKCVNGCPLIVTNVMSKQKIDQLKKPISK